MGFALEELPSTVKVWIIVAAHEGAQPPPPATLAELWPVRERYELVRDWTSDYATLDWYLIEAATLHDVRTFSTRAHAWRWADMWRTLRSLNDTTALWAVETTAGEILALRTLEELSEVV